MKDEAYYGGKIHEVLNKTLSRKLTMKEYTSIIKNIQNLLVACRKNEKEKRTVPVWEITQEEADKAMYHADEWEKTRL